MKCHHPTLDGDWCTIWFEVDVGMHKQSEQHRFIMFGPAIIILEKCWCSVKLDDSNLLPIMFLGWSMTVPSQ